MARFAPIAFVVMLVLAVGTVVAWQLRRRKILDADSSLTLIKLSVTLVGALGMFGLLAGSPSFGGAFIVPFSAVAFGVLFSILWTPAIARALISPLTNMIDGGNRAPDPEPFYSIAIAKRKKGQYREAVSDIQRQLEQFPHDVFGQMLLAEIQVEHLNDLAGAELTVRRLVAQPGHAPKNIAYALGTLADWHLKQGLDVEAARADLQQVIDRLPGTEEAALAAHRIGHLGTQEQLIAAREHAPVQLKEGVQNVGLLKDSSTLRRPQADPAELATQYVQHLAAHPFDSETRERLALIYAEHYQRLDLAVSELEQLVQQPNQPAKLVVHYLNTLADLHIQHGNDLVSATTMLERVIALNPSAAAANLAQSRIDHLKLELRKNEKSQVVKLGSYEQNIGLKKKT